MLPNRRPRFHSLPGTWLSALPDHPTVADLPRAVWGNKRYVLEESLSRKGSKGRKSWIKRHGLFLVEIDTDDSPLSPYWACRLCDAKGQPEFFAAAATNSAADHLRKSHRIFESSQAADPDLSTDESERPKRRRLQYSTVPRARVKTIRELSLGLLINTNVPFSFFSDTFFQQLAWQLDPHLSDQIPWSRQSMGRLQIKLILEPSYLQTMRTQGWGSEGGNGRLWEVMAGMEYLLEHLEDRKLFHHAVPDEAGGQDTNSQAELARGRPDRNRQLPARFRDCETDIHPRKSRQGPLSDRGSRQCDDGSGKPSGSLGIDDMGKDHRHYLRLSIMTAWQKLNDSVRNRRSSPVQGVWTGPPVYLEVLDWTA
ncbi:hypothetical protein FPOA_13745 [Fusarium poae]|uniref:BED-type domain-containing protein n=1 Tax=Fusarium poae TaxID=36050 RepID=A0A1B8A4L0_FUSPO|nr:hypothetical protein FPOA_13745 [Fusarium poae]